MNPPTDRKDTALVLFSHGSLLCGSGVMLSKHADMLRATGQYAAVEPGYLNYSEPRIEVAISRCVSAGATRVIIAPYFLVPGKFVLEDLPARIKQAASSFQGIEIILARPLEDVPPMVDAIDDLLQTAVPPEQWQKRAIARSRAACERRPDCPLYGSQLCKVNRP